MTSQQEWTDAAAKGDAELTITSEGVRIVAERMNAFRADHHIVTDTDDLTGETFQACACGDDDTCPGLHLLSECRRLVAERDAARADATDAIAKWKAAEARADHHARIAMNAQHQARDAEAEARNIIAERDALRDAIAAAPHAPFCQINAGRIINGERVTGQCDCWKDALAATETATHGDEACPGCGCEPHNGWCSTCGCLDNRVPPARIPKARAAQEDRHIAHYQSCQCLASAMTCCDPTCCATETATP